jgi:arylformamidase
MIDRAPTYCCADVVDRDTRSMTAPQHFSRDFCESEYDTARTAPDAAQVMKQRQELSTRALQTLRATVDVAYGPGEKQKLDVFRPEQQSRGVMVYFHGGYWQRMDKRDLSFLALPFVEAGFTFVNVNYTLAPAATLDAIVAEARAACAWTWENIADFGGERSNLHVSGSSAGGHLALMMSATCWPDVTECLPADLVKGTCGISGLYELEPLLYTRINDALGLDLEAAARNSPVLLKPTSVGPVLLAVGGRESSEFHRQTADLAQAWAGRAGGIEILQVPERHHFDILLDLADTSSALCRAVLQRMTATAS